MKQRRTPPTAADRYGIKTLQSSLKSMEGIYQCDANYVHLSPISFLERAGIAYADKVSIVYGSVRYTWRETLERCRRLASALTQMGISHGDIVAAFAPNIPALYELHFGTPMAGAILCALNAWQDSAMLSMRLSELEAKIIFVDSQHLEVVLEAFDILSTKGTKPPMLVLISENDQEISPTVSNTASGNLEYENLLAKGRPDFQVIRPKDECDPISVSYTSGTTSNPKGVVHCHRSAYLNSLAEILLNGMGLMPVYLWTVPMFHCNGWCFPWVMAALGGTNICLRNVSAKIIFDSIAEHKVTHLGGAPSILTMIANAPASDRKPLSYTVEIMTGGAPPPPQVLFNIEGQGFHVTHSYGMSETLGPGTVCMWKPEWESLPRSEQAKLKSRQGLQQLLMEDVDIKDPITMESLPSDGKTIGEVMLRGNVVMRGYFKNLKATNESFRGGWYRTGDLGVRYPDGYIEVKDRSVDVIVSGGENISTVEVETVLFSHPAIFEAVVVGRPDDQLGEVSCAFVKLKEECNASAEEIINFCGHHMPQYMVPRTVIFEEPPKTSTGKMQKYVLREKAKAMGSLPF
ncbi:hypothetical protein HHK36_010430 [Tetracentron sinense]|uniref:4-coumarate--CoA ligase n=1 Tax=Tetracentron sinense TaxID=13715 RepID=A0A835DJ52_TETSI|nr:hypothetical protein HHK36_010430 [Tetracentron sinense]